jgi:hypothetical protein
MHTLYALRTTLYTIQCVRFLFTRQRSHRQRATGMVQAASSAAVAQ